MKQEKAVLAKTDGLVSRVLKSANYQQDKRMVPVKEGELLVELSSAPASCPNCNMPVPGEDFVFCPFCGHSMKEE
jgi:pyruvate carboxylase